MQKWARLNYQVNLPLGPNGKRVTACEEHAELSRHVARDGMVLLKNNNEILPLPDGCRIALFGKASFDYVRGGGGSGEVFPPYVTGLYDGLKEKPVAVFEPLSDFYRQNVSRQLAAGAVPGLTEEPAIPAELLAGARQFADVAIVTICRFSGEGWDRLSPDVTEADQLWDNIAGPAALAGRIFPKSDFYLTEAEEKMVAAVTEVFPRVVAVLNVGGAVDVRWIKDNDRIQGALVMWAAGMEGGAAAADLLMGDVCPSGRLADTFAEDLQDYPSTAGFDEARDHVDYTEDVYVGYRYFQTLPGAQTRVCYPFGYGLSYTTFETRPLRMVHRGDDLVLETVVENTGSRAGKEVVQVYCEGPQGRILRPRRTLTAFGKTILLAPGQQQRLTLTVPLRELAAFDDVGAVSRWAWVLEKGEYRLCIGRSAGEMTALVGTFFCEQDTVLEQLCSRLAPSRLARRLNARGELDQLPRQDWREPEKNDLTPLTEEEMECMAPRVKARDSKLFLAPCKKGAHTLFDVAEGNTTVEAFLQQMDDEELADLLGGQPNTGVGITFGIGNNPDYAVPNVMTADGPAGVRIQPWTGVFTTAWPCATLLACTWDAALTEAVGRAGGAELKENNMGIWLAPAINIHRSPLCGRNFEYFSEDPLLTGKLAAAMVRGIQSNRVSACVKHFAFNNKETNRKYSDSRLSQRAAREIYLKAFEIVVKEAHPWCIMSSYNLVNGCRCAQNRELLEDILRGEWGFDGVVTTDWWGYSEEYLEIKAGNDLKMGLGYPERVREAMERGLLSRNDLLRSARRIIELILRLD